MQLNSITYITKSSATAKRTVRPSYLVDVAYHISHEKIYLMANIL